MRTTKHFLSFGDKRLEKSLARIKSQAEEMSVYDRIYCWDEGNLDEIFWQKHRAFCENNRGFGFWIFKPQVVLQVLDKMELGDVLHYSDVGCHLHKYGRKRLCQYFDRISQSKSGILAFRQGHAERRWTKGDLFDYFGVRSQPEITDSTQHWGGSFFIKKSDKSAELIRKWLSVFDHIHLIDDSPSVSPNFDDFIEHRHDQSCFSILCKMNDIPTIPAHEHICYPITAARDKEWAI
jgi:hypothetical protein